MWLIQDKALMQLPDGAAIPPGFKKVKPPDGFEANPAMYRINDGKIIALSKKEVVEQQKPSRLSLTQEEIAILKRAIERGFIS